MRTCLPAIHLFTPNRATPTRRNRLLKAIRQAATNKPDVTRTKNTATAQAVLARARAVAHKVTAVCARTLHLASAGHLVALTGALFCFHLKRTVLTHNTLNPLHSLCRLCHSSAPLNEGLSAFISFRNGGSGRIRTVDQ
jgi:hypothetical protein